MKTLRRKVLILTAILVPESREKSDGELEAEVRKELDPKEIPYCEKIEHIKVLSEE